MPESPDFEQLARDMVDGFIETGEAQTSNIVAYFRQIWNARGAADLAKLDAVLSILQANNTAGRIALPYVKHLDRELRILDR